MKYTAFFTNMVHIPKAGKQFGVPVFRNEEGELVPTTADVYHVPDFFAEGTKNFFVSSELLNARGKLLNFLARKARKITQLRNI
jgi:hypothetical protein